MPRKTLLVRGVGSHNGGAELLLRAASDRLVSSETRVAADARRVSKELRKAWGVGAYLSVPRLGRFESLGLDFLPKPLAESLGAFSTRTVDGVVDASGFFVGDQWRADSIARDGESFQKLSQRGKPVVMLPQAFGPFTEADVAVASRELFRHVDLIVARDSESYSHVEQLLGDDSKLALCPDITIALESGSSSPDRSARKVAIVPNINIVSRSKNPDDAGRYSASLEAMYQQLSASGYEPFFLVHSSHGDPKVIEEIKVLNESVRVVIPSNGLDAKKIIDGCVGTIAGRYHAIVSALSQGVPAVAHSWSHKYGALLKDFAVSEGLADPMDADGSVVLLDSLINDPKYAASITAAKPELLATIDRTWDRINSALNAKDKDR